MIDDEIRDALKIDPAPEFLARVRTRIAIEPEPGGWRGAWTFAAAGALAAGIVLAVVVSRTAFDVVPAPVPKVVQAFRPAWTMPLPGAANASAERPSSGAKASAERETPRSQPSTPTRSPDAFAPRERVALPESETLIDPRERRALLALIAGIRDGRIDLTAAQRSATPAPMELGPVADIVIAPLTIDPLAPVSGAEGVRP